MADKAYEACKAALEALKVVDPTLQFKDWEDGNGRQVEKKMATAAAKCKAVVDKGPSRSAIGAGITSSGRRF